MATILLKMNMKTIANLFSNDNPHSLKSPLMDALMCIGLVLGVGVLGAYFTFLIFGIAAIFVCGKTECTGLLIFSISIFGVTCAVLIFWGCYCCCDYVKNSYDDAIALSNDYQPSVDV